MATTAVYIRAFRPVARRMKLPRVLLTDFPMGRPLGVPGDAAGQRRVVAAALSLIEEAEGPGTIVEHAESYHVSSPGLS